MIFDLCFEVWLRSLSAGGIDGPTLRVLSFHNKTVLVIASWEETFADGDGHSEA